MMPAVSPLTHVQVGMLHPERFREAIDHERYERFAEVVARARELFAGRVVWNVNSTARGGGVAEMLRPLLAYARGGGVDARWVVIEGNPDFFRVTKRIHNNLHGAEGDGGGLGDQERQVYEEALRLNAEELAESVRPEDVVVLHDPQTAGLVSAVKARGSPVIWRCHVGLDMPNELARRAWRFLIPYIQDADGYIFSREAFAWEGLDEDKITIIPPSIDAFSPKNQELDDGTVRAILAASGLIRDGAGAAARFVREDGSPGRVDRRAQTLEVATLAADDRVVLQVSRWDRLKDPLGVIAGFAEHVAPHHDAHLVYAGPDVAAVADDPEGAEVLREAEAAWHELPPGVRARVHLTRLPLDDGEENAAIVNALQRHATVVVQKSLAEGFGLTVAEAMWKARPLVASRIGGIQDQVVDGVTGLLVDDPTDLASFGAAVGHLLADPDEAERMGREAMRRVREEYLGARHLIQYFELISKLLGGVSGWPAAPCSSGAPAA
jgi:trehalose synthase